MSESTVIEPWSNSSTRFGRTQLLSPSPPSPSPRGPESDSESTKHAKHESESGLGLTHYRVRARTRSNTEFNCYVILEFLVWAYCSCTANPHASININECTALHFSTLAWFLYKYKVQMYSCTKCRCFNCAMV